MAKNPGSLEFILLGLLALRPATGYDLKKTMDLSVRYISPFALSQIYPTLKRLAADGLVTYQVVERSGKTNLKIYSITAAGQERFRQWLASPYTPDPYRFDTFTLRFYFSSLLDQPTLLTHIRTELAFRQAQLKTARAFELTDLGHLQPVEAVDLQRTVKFWALYHQYGLEFMETYTRWLEHILGVVEAGL
jgi:DNA-binding PadR family transcriptional regulator